MAGVEQLARAHALDAMERDAIREKQLATYNSTLGSFAFFLSVLLHFTLPSPWKVLNGEWSSAIVPSLLALCAHGVLVLSAILALKCAQVQGEELLRQFNEKYLRSRKAALLSPEPVDRAAALNDVMTFKSLRSISPTLKAASASKKAANEVAQRSFFDPEPVKTVEDGKAYLRKLQQAQKQREEEESLQSSTFGVGASFQNDGFNGIYGNASMVPRVYQASGFDPYIQESTKEQEEDALQTSSNPLVAWRQLEEWGIAMFMHLYCRNIRRLLAYHVKDFVEAFIQNASELNECGVMADVLLRRMPSQALLCPPGQTNQMTNVSLSDMLHGLTKSPLFVSKTRGVNLFEEHTSFDKYLNVGDPNSTEYSSLERQQYVLERLIMLSKDRSLDRYRWSKGSTWKGKEWSDSLPSDAEILMNVFCCMMDNMLPADSERDRPFWKSYFLSKGPRRPFTPSVRSRLFVVRTVGRPPHFKVLARAGVREIVPGEENCFHAIVVFLHAVKKMKAGYLESINLHRIIEQVFDVAK
uniref:Transmembrane protein n=1 Tax=Globisporangium ultimum (strain ATCC 200006 / CBS 805.95 / DAOM BR144) TaxID=431595 RepID=K3X6G3_GLOUD